MKSSPAVSALRARPLVVVAAVILFAASLNAVLAGCGQKNETKDEGGATSTSETTTPPAPTGATAGPVDGAKVYADRCALCHGPNGKGDGPAAAGLNPKPRNHTDGSYMNARTNEELLTVIRNGKGAMPAWKDVLTEEEIQAVLKHVRSLAVPAYPG